MTHSNSKNIRNFIVEDYFNSLDQAILDITDYLDTATETDKAHILFKNHQGGHVDAAELFIDAVEQSKIGRIEITFDRFAISAAAFIYAYFVYYASSSRVVVKTDNPLCLVYHKPRMKKDGCILFDHHIIDKQTTTPQVRYLLRVSKRFDDVFQSMWTAVQKMIDIAPHMKDVYNNNGDVSIVFQKGIQSHV